uniref:DNA-dependent RNA polymerase i subunit a43 n=1 Tax=Colletotrichum fructicola (strain Nara gc5) TaxID=1213859 RepID=L2FP87_COLFN
MEGVINLENEGHIGVVCWSKFNASIESARLPAEWRWVHADSAEAAQYVADPFAAEEDAAEAQAAEDEHGAVRQIHTTGFWVDGAGEKVKGRVRFRIKAFDVGSGGILSKERRRMPEFSVTKFGVVEDEEEKALKQDVWNTTTPVTDDEGAGKDKEAFAGIAEE